MVSKMAVRELVPELQRGVERSSFQNKISVSFLFLVAVDSNRGFAHS